MARGCSCAFRLAALGVDVPELGAELGADMDDAIDAVQAARDQVASAFAAARGVKPTPEEMEWMLHCAARPWLLRCLLGPPGSPGRKRAGVALEVAALAALVYFTWRD